MSRALDLGAALLAFGLAIVWFAVFGFIAWRSLTGESFVRLDFVSQTIVTVAALVPPLLAAVLGYLAIRNGRSTLSYGFAALATMICACVLLAIAVGLAINGAS